MTTNIALTAVAGAGPLTTPEGAVAQRSGTLVAAHRGGALLWPENSLLATDAALKTLAEYAEERRGMALKQRNPSLLTPDGKGGPQ